MAKRLLRPRRKPEGFDWREALYVGAIMSVVAFLLVVLWLVAGGSRSISPQCAIAYWNCGR